MKASKVLLSSNCPYLWCSCGTRKSPRRYKPSHGKIFFKFEKSSRCGGLVQASINTDIWCAHKQFFISKIRFY